MKRRRLFETLTTALLAVLIGTVLAAPAMAQGKGGEKNKDKDDGSTVDPAPLPPIEYTIRNFAPPHRTDISGHVVVNDLSNTGMVVGHYVTSGGLWHGWLYDPNSESAVASDLNDIAEVPPGWFIANALGVNDLGMVVGYIASDADREVRQGFVLDTLSEEPTLRFLPDSAYSHTYARKINNNLDIMGVFRRNDSTWGVYIYNPFDDEEELEIVDVNLYAPAATGLNNPMGARPAQIVGTTPDWVPFVYTRGEEGPVYLSDATPDTVSIICGDINDVSTICGTLREKEEKTVRRNKTETHYWDYLFRDSGYPEIFDESKGDSGKYHARSINSHGAILTGGSTSGNKNYVYTDAWGFVDVALLVDHPDPSRLVSTKINDASVDVAGFGELAGTERIDLGDGTTTTLLYILTPVTPAN